MFPWGLWYQEENLISFELIISVFFYFAVVTDVEAPAGLFRWGTSDDSSVLATWHFGGSPFELKN